MNVKLIYSGPCTAHHRSQCFEEVVVGKGVGVLVAGVERLVHDILQLGPQRRYAQGGWWCGGAPSPGRFPAAFLRLGVEVIDVAGRLISVCSQEKGWW